MNERDLDYFVAVAKHAHLGRAAEALGLSQPALSMSLRRLERLMETKLVKRTPKGVELTPVGETLLSHIDRLRLARRDVMREIADLSQGSSGELRIGIQSGFPEELVGLASGALLRETQKVVLRASVSPSSAILAALRSGQLDVVVISVPSAAAVDIVLERLLDDEFIVYAAAQHPLARRRKVPIFALAEYPWVKAGSTGTEELDRLFQQHGLSSPHVVVESNSSAIRRHAVASSDALGWGSRRMVERHKRIFDLEEVSVDGLPAVRPVDVAYRKDGYLSPASRRFIGLLKKAAKEI